MKEYALYQGDSFVDIGTIAVLSDKWGISQSTLRWSASGVGKRRREGKRLRKDTIIVIPIEEDEDGLE
jgi:hypothetical protein